MLEIRDFVTRIGGIWWDVEDSCWWAAGPC